MENYPMDLHPKLRKGIPKLIMRTFIFLCCTMAFALGPNKGLAQNATIKITKNKLFTVKQVFKLIDKQTNYKFIYRNDLVRNNPGVVLKKGEIKAGELLKKILLPSDLTYEYKRNGTIVVVKIPSLIQNQETTSGTVQQKITGKVVDSDDVPLPGANILEKGTTNGTQVDFDGNFSIQVSGPNAVLVVSYVGYTTREIAVGTQTTLTVKMNQDSAQLDEVVVIGYGTQKKSNLTAAVEMVDTKLLENRPVRTVGEMLEGAVPNLNISLTSGAPDASPSFNIRGFTGFNTSAQPLFLVDGVEQDINLINANDVESISVLKDAAASAIYGSRAPHGVILVTTKSGKKGQKMQINFSSNTIVSTPTYLWEPTKPWIFQQTANEKFRNSQSGVPFSEETIQQTLDNAAGIGPNNVVRGNGRYGFHTFATNGSENRIESAYRDMSVSAIQNLSITGGSDKTTYYIGTGYLKKDGIYNSSVDFSKRYTALAKISTDIADWLTVRSQINFKRQEVVRPNYRDSNSSDATDDAIQGNGNLYYFPNVPSINPNGAWHWLSAVPVIRGETGQANRNTDDILVSGGFDIKPLNNLIVTGDISYLNTTGFLKKDTKFLRVLDADGNLYPSGRTARYDEVEESFSKTQGHSISLHTTYNKKINKHDFLAQVGFQQDIRKFFSLSASNRDFYSTDVISLSTSFGDNIQADDRIWEWATRGYFFRASYNFDGKYLLDFNSRYDAASKFAADTRWAFFPSVSAGYNIAKEDFWPLKDVQTFKLTGSWGKSGDQNLDFNGDGSFTSSNSEIYVYLPTLGNGAQTPYLLDNDRPPFVSQPGIVSPDLTWAKPRTIGAALEITAFKNRLQTEYRWFQRTVFDQFGPADRFPEVLGTTPPQLNNAVSETRGWEFSLAWDDTFNIKGEPFHYGFRGILSDYVGYVVDYQENVSGSKSNTWTPGERFGVVRGYTDQQIIKTSDELFEKLLWRGGWNYPGSTYIPDLNGDGRINGGDGGFWYSEGDQVDLGFSYPRYKYSATLNASWKNWDINVLLDGVGKEFRYSGNAIFIGSAVSGWETHSLQQHNDQGYFTLNNPDAFYPRIFQSGGSGIQPTKKYGLNVGHLRIKNVNIGYSFPNSLTDRLKMNYIKLNLSIENLGFIYNNLRVKMDPAQIRNARTYPIQRVFSFGLNFGL